MLWTEAVDLKRPSRARPGVVISPRAPAVCGCYKIISAGITEAPALRIVR